MTTRTRTDFERRTAWGCGIETGASCWPRSHTTGVAFFDVTDARERLPLLAELDIPGVEAGSYAGAWWVGLQAPIVYVAAVGRGLYVVDASDPRAPSVAKHVTTGALGGISPGTVFPVGNLLVLAEGRNRGYATMDISDPVNPTLIEVREGASGYSHLFTAGLLLTSGSPVASPFREAARGRGGDPNRMYVHRIGHDGRIAYAGEAGSSLGGGGYGSYQDGHFLSGFSDTAAKFSVDPPRQLGSSSAPAPNADVDFAQPLGNLMFAGDDHGIDTSLIPHQAEPDTRGPEVVWVHPPDGATGVAVTARVGVSMSDEVAAESLAASSFVVRPRGGAPVPGELSVNQNNVNFFPDEDLAEDTVYEVEVCGLSDLVGNAGGCASSMFTTRGADAALPSCRLGLLDPVAVHDAVTYESAAVTGTPTTYEWRFGDGQTFGPRPSGLAEVTHSVPGRYSVTLRVSNAHGAGSCGGTRIVHSEGVQTAEAPVSSGSIAIETSVYSSTGSRWTTAHRGHHECLRGQSGPRYRDADQRRLFEGLGDGRRGHAAHACRGSQREHLGGA